MLPLSQYKPFFFSLFLLLKLSLWCNAPFAQTPLEVLTCEPEWAALVKSLTGELAVVYSATTAQQDPHHIEARPSLIAKARRAKLLVCTGAELEVGWLPLLLSKSGNGQIQPGQPGFFMAAEQVNLLEKPILLDRSQGDIHAAGNPHIHLDPQRILSIATALAAQITTLDPTNQARYQHHLTQFTQQWQHAIEQWQIKTQALRNKAIVVNHNNWLYLEHWLGLKRIATLEPKPGVPATSHHLSQVLASLQATPADFIVQASYEDNKAARWLSQKTGLPVLILPFSVAENETLLHWFDRLLSQLLTPPQ